MEKILELTKEQLLKPPTLEIKKTTITMPKSQRVIELTQKRKHFQSASAYSPLSKRRKLSSDFNNNNNMSKQRVIWDGLLINDSVKCHVKMKQIGGKSIWTLPFKQIKGRNNNNNRDNEH